MRAGLVGVGLGGGGLLGSGGSGIGLCIRFLGLVVVINYCIFSGKPFIGRKRKALMILVIDESWVAVDRLLRPFFNEPYSICILHCFLLSYLHICLCL